MREGREPARGRDTRHVLPSLAGAPAGKAPACGRLAALRGACLGLAGRGNGRHSRPQAAFPRAPPRANARGGGACAASARGGLNCGPPQRREPNDRRKPGESLPPAGGRAPEGRLGASGRSPEAQAPKGRYAGRRVRRQSRAARPAPQAWPGWQGWPKRRRTGRRRGRPHSPHIVGAGPRRSTDAATGEGEERGKAARSAHRRCLALRRGRVPPSNGGGQLARAGLARPWPPHYPDCRRQAGRAAAPPPHRVGRVSARRPEGRVGRGPAHRATDGSPFPWALSGRENEKRECPPGTPSCLLIKATRPAVVKSDTCPRPRFVKSHISDTSSIAGSQHRGFAPVPRHTGFAGKV